MGGIGPSHITIHFHPERLFFMPEEVQQMFVALWKARSRSLPADHGYTHLRKRHHSAATLLPGPPSTGLLRSAPPTPGERWNREAPKERAPIYRSMPPTEVGGS
jgi:hypothetical protein